MEPNDLKTEYYFSWEDDNPVFINEDEWDSFEDEELSLNEESKEESYEKF